MKHPIGHTRNGIAVYVDLINSEAAKHIAPQPHILGLIAEALKQTSPRGTDVTIEQDLGRVIGYSFVVSTTDSDAIFYAQILKDKAYTRFTKNGKPLATQYITLILHRNEGENEYELLNAWIGRLSPPKPGNEGETVESRSFWANHAHVLENQTLQLRTLTKVCPY